MTNVRLSAAAFAALAASAGIPIQTELTNKQRRRLRQWKPTVEQLTPAFRFIDGMEPLRTRMPKPVKGKLIDR